MLNEQKIIFVAIVDNKNRSYNNLSMRIYQYQKQINKLLKEETCLIGKNTYETTQWKGPNTWVLTSKRNWRKSNVGTIHSIDDLHLFTEGPIYVLGGMSLYVQLKDFVDEMHLYVFNNDKGIFDWIDFDMKHWKALDFITNDIWSYAHLKYVKNTDPHRLNKDILKDR